MPEIDRLYGGCDCIDLAFVEQERASRQTIELGIQLHLAGSSCSNTKQYLERSGVERGRTAIHNWIQQTNVQPTSEAEPNHIALAETVIQLDDGRHGCTPLSILIPMNPACAAVSDADHRTNATVSPQTPREGSDDERFNILNPGYKSLGGSE